MPPRSTGGLQRSTGWPGKRVRRGRSSRGNFAARVSRRFRRTVST